MKKLFLSIILISLVGGLFAQGTPSSCFDSKPQFPSYCFEPKSQITINAQLNFMELTNSGANTTTADGYLYIKMPGNFTDMISLKLLEKQVQIEFASSDTSYINSHLDYLNSLDIFLFNIGYNTTPKILKIENASCRLVLIRPVAEKTVRPAQVPAPQQATDEPEILAVENEQKDFTMGSGEVDKESPKGSTSIEDMLFPLALGVISTLFLVIIAVHFRGQLFRPLDYDQEITLGKTQLEILEELSDAQKIPTDIAIRVKKSKSTVIEHLEHLQKMGLIEKAHEQGRKFVYYRLSSSGKRILLKKNQAA